MHQLNFLKITKQRQPLRCEKFLNEMDQVIPWQRLCDLITPFRPVASTGRKAKETELMLRINCLQQWYGLSDPGVEDAIKDRLSFQRFLRLDPFTDTVPDETTILNFKCQWGFRKVRYRRLKKNTGQLFMLFGLYNLFRVSAPKNWAVLGKCTKHEVFSMSWSFFAQLCGSGVNLYLFFRGSLALQLQKLRQL